MAKRASDVYLLPKSECYDVMYYTAKGVELCDHYALEIGAAIIRYIKYEARMDISERRRPQLGRWLYPLQDRTLNLRISSVGDFLNNESIVIRLLYEQDQLEVEDQCTDQLIKLEQTIVEDKGLIIVAGKMGSGKTTTLYRSIENYAKEEMVLTIEDPVEIIQPNFLQLQVNNQANMSYATLLKLALRHHPDMMLIGEIRDSETAKIAVEAALSGHLIMTTMHAMSILGVYYRLVDFGVPEKILRQAISGIGYQTMKTDNNQVNVEFTFKQRGEFNTLLMTHKG